MLTELKAKPSVNPNRFTVGAQNTGRTMQRPTSQLTALKHDTVELRFGAAEEPAEAATDVPPQKRHWSIRGARAAWKQLPVSGKLTVGLAGLGTGIAGAQIPPVWNNAVAAANWASDQVTGIQNLWLNVNDYLIDGPVNASTVAPALIYTGATLTGGYWLAKKLLSKAGTKYSENKTEIWNGVYQGKEKAKGRFHKWRSRHEDAAEAQRTLIAAAAAEAVREALARHGIKPGETTAVSEEAAAAEGPQVDPAAPGGGGDNEHITLVDRDEANGAGDGDTANKDKKEE